MQPVEIWYRNPVNYMRECAEVGVSRFTFDYGLLRKRGLDPETFVSLYMGASRPWEYMLIGEQGAAHFTHESNREPVGVYPVWEYGHSIDDLETMLANPAGEDEELCFSKLPDDERPVYGQKHIVLVNRLPSLVEINGKRFINLLREMQDDFPEATIFVHGSYSIRALCGFNFKAGDFEPRNAAGAGEVWLPNGAKIHHRKIYEWGQWLRLLGYTPHDMAVPRNRCMASIKAIEWAAENFQEAIKFKTKGFELIDPDNPFRSIPVNRRIKEKNRKAQGGDKFVCDICSLQTTCKFFRVGAVCIVPESEPLGLAKMFKSRDSQTIIDGLGTLLSVQTERLQTGLNNEREDRIIGVTKLGEVVMGPPQLDPEVTKIVNTMFDRATKLAKLIDPSLVKPSISFQQNNGTIIAGSNPQQLMAAIVDELTSRGVARDAITPEMIQNLLSKPDEVRQHAIEAAVTKES